MGKDAGCPAIAHSQRGYPCESTRISRDPVAVARTWRVSVRLRGHSSHCACFDAENGPIAAPALNWARDIRALTRKTSPRRRPLRWRGDPATPPVSSSPRRWPAGRHIRRSSSNTSSIWASASCHGYAVTPNWLSMELQSSCEFCGWAAAAVIPNRNVRNRDTRSAACRGLMEECSATGPICAF